MADYWLLAAIHARLQPFSCVKLQTFLVFRCFFVLLFGQFSCRSAGFGLLRALGNGRVTGASSAIVAPLQRLIPTDLAAVVVAPVTPGVSHRLSSSREKVIVYIFSKVPAFILCLGFRASGAHYAIYRFLGKYHV